MVIKGRARGGPRALADHLDNEETNERVHLRETRGVVAMNLHGALREMAAVASATRCTRPLYHASINTRADEAMTEEQWNAAIDRLETKLGLTGQPRVVVEHGKKGREHVHVVWSRIDLDHMRAISDSHNYRKHEEVSRELEREFGHARVQGAHAERDGKERPERTPSHAEMQQGARSGLTPKEAKAQITRLWQQTDSGAAFAAALEDAGWTLARGDRRDFVLVDPHGEPHSLARRVDGVKAAEVRARMADLDIGRLPTVDQARARQEGRELEHQSADNPEARIPETEIPAAPTPEPPRDIELDERPLQMEHQPDPAPLINDGRSPAQSGGDSILNVFSDLLSETTHNVGFIAGELASEARFVVGELTAAVPLTEFAAQELERRGDEPPPREFSAEELADSAEARRAYYTQQSATRERNAAIDRMAEDIGAGRDLKPDDVRALRSDDLAGIKEHGDEHLGAIIDARQREPERDRER